MYHLRFFIHNNRNTTRKACILFGSNLSVSNAIHLQPSWLLIKYIATAVCKVYPNICHSEVTNFRFNNWNQENTYLEILIIWIERFSVINQAYLDRKFSWIYNMPVFVSWIIHDPVTWSSKKINVDLHWHVWSWKTPVRHYYNIIIRNIYHILSTIGSTYLHLSIWYIFYYFLFFSDKMAYSLNDKNNCWGDIDMYKW